MTPHRRDRDQVLALLDRVRDLTDLLAESQEQATDSIRRELVASSRSLSATISGIDARLDEVESLERERDHLLDRLIVVESALQSTSEDRDTMALLIAEIWEIVTGEAGGGKARDLVAAIRELNRRAGQSS